MKSISLSPAQTPPSPGFTQGAAALSAAAVTVPHAVGLGLLAFAPLAGSHSQAALALWSAALPGLVMTLLAPRPGVIYAPTTVVALLFAGVVAAVQGSAATLGLDGPQVLAVCAVTMAMAFSFQWLFGLLRLASLSRFLPISVTHGFAAGVGLSMVASQWRGGFGAGAWTWDLRVLAHLLVAAAVMGLAVLIQRRWRQVPGLLPAVFVLAAGIVLSGLGPWFKAAAAEASFSWPMLPDWGSVAWGRVFDHMGWHLVSMALLMAVVNSLEILVFVQELELDHGVRADPNRVLRRESALGALCGLMGLIPSSTSPSRSRIALEQAAPAARVGQIHAGLMMGVALTGHWWLHSVPMACLAGGLMLAGIKQLPKVMWSRRYAQLAPATWTQSWLVAIVFVLSGGAGALLAGLLVATFLLLHVTANGAVRRIHLDGQLRSRRLRRAVSDAWLAHRMDQVAVFELQGVMSFGVAAHVAEQVRVHLLPRHGRLILDSARVPAWDETALAQLRALSRDLDQRGVQLAVCGVDQQSRVLLGDEVRQFSDLDRALEWAEDGLLEQRSADERMAYPEHEPLGELGEGLGEVARRALEALLRPHQVEAGQQVFEAGETGRDLWLVDAGHVTMATQWPAGQGLRLATIGKGMAFGEMAFLSGQPRSACAGAEEQPARLWRLAREDFDEWARAHPVDALGFMSNLAQIGIRRLGATTRQLRSVLE